MDIIYKDGTIINRLTSGNAKHKMIDFRKYKITISVISSAFNIIETI